MYDSQPKHILPTFGDVALDAMTRRAVRAWDMKVSVAESELQAAKCYRPDVGYVLDGALTRTRLVTALMR